MTDRSIVTQTAEAADGSGETPDIAGEPIQFTLQGLFEPPTNMSGGGRLWNVVVTKSKMVVYRADSGAVALLGPIAVLAAQNQLRKKDLAGKTIDEVTEGCFPRLVFDRTKGPVRLPCNIFGKPGKTMMNLHLYLEDKDHTIMLPGECAAQLQAACPELVLEALPVSWMHLPVMFVGFPLVLAGGLTLCSLITHAFSARDAETGIPLSFPLGLLMLLGGALVVWWSLQAKNFGPGNRKFIGTCLVILGVSGLIGTAILLGPVMDGEAQRGWQAILLVGGIISAAIAVNFIVFGVRSRRRGVHEIHEQKKLMTGKEVLRPGH